MRIPFFASLSVLLMAAPTQAAIVITMAEVGADVVVQGSGTVGTLPTVEVLDDFIQGYLNPSEGQLVLGPLFPVSDDPPRNTKLYREILGPTSFGAGTNAFASIGTGSPFGVYIADATEKFLALPSGYELGTELSSTNTYLGASFSSLGVTPGVYTWTWGSGTATDSLTLRIGEVPPVPLPAAAWLLLSGLAGLGVLGRRRRLAKVR